MLLAPCSKKLNSSQGLEYECLCLPLFTPQVKYEHHTQLCCIPERWSEQYLERNIQNREKKKTDIEHRGHITWSEVQALPKSCFHLPMSSDHFLMINLQIEADAHLFYRQNVCVWIFLL